jgi:hypothetical protein
VKWSLVIAAGVAVLATAASSGAYSFEGVRWPGGVVPYYNAAPDQAWAVSRAVQAWNHSGAKIRFVSVPRSAAKLVIEEDPTHVYCREGRASVGYYAQGAHVTIFPARGLTHACNKYWAARVVTHELGHVLGLQHEDRACATMNSTGNLHGGARCDASPPWDWRCRLLEPDDVDGAVAAYGGTSLPPAREPWCPLYGAIAPPGGLTAAYDAATAQVTLTFTRPATPVIPSFLVPSPWKPRTSFAIAGVGAPCHKHNDPDGALHGRWDVQPRRTEKIAVPARSGTSCYTVWAFDSLGRPSARAATVRLTIS